MNHINALKAAINNVGKVRHWARDPSILKDITSKMRLIISNGGDNGWGMQLRKI